MGGVAYTPIRMNITPEIREQVRQRAHLLEDQQALLKWLLGK
jgi:hypothetical protein